MVPSLTHPALSLLQVTLLEGDALPLQQLPNGGALGAPLMGADWTQTTRRPPTPAGRAPVGGSGGPAARGIPSLRPEARFQYPSWFLASCLVTL
jgi:hypothetical protein